MRIDFQLATNLSGEQRAALQDKTDREFGQFEIVRTHVWAEPTWIVLGYEQDRLVSFLSLVDRNASADDRPVHLFGLSNVITEPAERHRGHSRSLNGAALDFMRQQDPNAFALLFCADHLLSFYAGLGWQRFVGRVLVSQPSGDRIWPSNCMVHTLGRPQPLDAQQIHLGGLPW